MKRSWITSVLVPLAIVVVGAVSCDRILRTLRGDSDQATVVPVEESTTAEGDRPVGTQALNTNEGQRILTNEAAGIQIELPASWSEDPRLNQVADLQAADPENQLYLVVVAEEAEPLMLRGLDENAARYRDLLAQRLAVYEGESKTDVAFVGDNFATQYEMRGRLENNTPVVYLHTTVVSENRYYQVVGWTTPDQYEAYRSELQNIIDTFRESGS
jgi:hypothetical protein